MDVLIERDREIVMRDGAVLRADIFRPADDGRFPVLLQRTAYSKEAVRNPAPIDPIYAASQGVVVVIQDVRGKFTSDGGSWYMFRDEFDDGYDSVEWAASQPFSNGHVGLYGISYMANTSWQAAIAAPPSLGAIAPTQAPIDYTEGWDWLTRNNVLKWGLTLNWTLQSIAEAEVRKHATGDTELRTRLDRLAEVVDDRSLFWKTPLVAVADELQEIVGPGRDASDPPLEFFRDVVTRTLPKSWHSLPYARTHERVRVPALITAGWYDVILGHDLEHYARMRRSAGTTEAREQTRMVIGHWAHGAASMLQTWTGEVDFGRRSTGASVDFGPSLGMMQVDWFKHQLGGDGGSPDEGPRVKVFVQGVNRWQDEDDWPIPRARRVNWYLRDGGGLTTDTGGADEPYATFVYDPRDPCPTRGGDLVKPPIYVPGPVDQRPLLDRRDVLVYTSDVLSRGIEVIGPVTASLSVATSGPSTDFTVKLCDVHPDGRTINMCDGIARMSAAPGAVTRVDVDMWATGVVFQAGHRIRVLVSSSDFPRYERNPNTGQNPWEAAVFEPALQRVFHDGNRPSCVTLPVTG